MQRLNILATYPPQRPRPVSLWPPDAIAVCLAVLVVVGVALQISVGYISDETAQRTFLTWPWRRRWLEAWTRSEY